MYKAIILTCMLMYERLQTVHSLSYELSPSFVNTGDGFQQVCTFTSSLVLTRGEEPCIFGCSVFGCSLTERADIDCNDTWIQIYISNALIEDFEKWTCSGDSTFIDRSLTEYVATTLTYTTSEREVIEGQQYTFTCQAKDGVPGSVIKWKVNGSPNDEDVLPQINETSTQTSTFMLTAGRSQTTIQCVADQVHNKVPVSADLIQLTVLYPPTGAITLTPTVTSVINETVEFECQVQGEGNPQDYEFVWTRAADSDYKEQTDNGNLKFVVTSVEFEDTYYCTPENTAGPGQPASMSLTVNSMPQLVNPQASPHIVFYTDNLTLDCVVEAKPKFDQIQWRIYDDVFKSTDQGSEPNGKLTKHTVRLEWNTEDKEKRKDGNGKVVSCFADNGIGSFSVEHFVTINTEYTPARPIIEANQTSVDVLNTVVFSCQFDTPEPSHPSVTRYNYISEAGWSEQKNGSTVDLYIGSITQETGYSCAGINYPLAYPEGKEGQMSEPANLQVLVPPQIISPTSDYETHPIYNEEFTLTCQATGKPQVEVTWLKDGRDIADGEFKPQIDSEIDIIDGPYDLQKGINSDLPSIRRGSEDTCETVTKYDGDYQCVASNAGSGGSQESSFITIRTQYPALWYGPNVTKAELNKTLTINCSICAEPMPDIYKWYKDGLILNETGSQVVIGFFTKDDTGTYQCEIDNGIGSSCNYSIHVIGIGPPSITNLNTGFNITSTVIPITWIIENYGDYPPVTFTIWTKPITSGTFEIWKEMIWVEAQEGDIVLMDIDGLAPNREYDIKVIAQNTRPSGEITSQPLYTRGLTGVSPIIDIDLVLVSDYDLMLTWTYQQTVLKQRKMVNSQVTLCIKYWVSEDGEGSSEIYPGPGQCVIKAYTGQEVITGTFDPTLTYYVELITFENGLLGSNSGKNFAVSETSPESTSPAATLSPGGIAAIVVSVILVLMLFILAVLLLSGALYFNVHCFKDSQGTAKKYSRKDDPAFEQTGYIDIIPENSRSDNKDNSEVQLGCNSHGDQTYEQLHQQQYENTGFQPYEALDAVIGYQNSSENV